jgi:hypothetical protein
LLTTFNFKECCGKFLWHPADKPAGILIFNECDPYADVTAAGAWTGEVFRHLIHANIPVNDLEKKLQRALQPDMKAPHTRSLDDGAVVQIS